MVSKFIVSAAWVEQRVSPTSMVNPMAPGMAASIVRVRVVFLVCLSSRDDASQPCLTSMTLVCAGSIAVPAGRSIDGDRSFAVVGLDFGPSWHTVTLFVG